MGVGLGVGEAGGVSVADGVAVSVAVAGGEGVNVRVGVSLRKMVGVTLAGWVGVGVGPILKNGLRNRPEQKQRAARSAAPAINNPRFLLSPAFWASYFF